MCWQRLTIDTRVKEEFCKPKAIVSIRFLQARHTLASHVPAEASGFVNCFGLFSEAVKRRDLLEHVRGQEHSDRSCRGSSNEPMLLCKVETLL